MSIYGETPIQRNWNRMAELSRVPLRTGKQEAEYRYRVSVQNYFSAHGRMPPDYTEPQEAAS